MNCAVSWTFCSHSMAKASFLALPAVKWEEGNPILPQPQKRRKKRKSWRRPEKKWHITYKGIMISIRGDFQSETTRSWRKCSDGFKVLREKRIVNSEFYTSWKYHSKWSFLVQHGRSLEVITPDQTTRGKWTDHQQLFLDPSENGGQKKRNGICMSSSRD